MRPEHCVCDLTGLTVLDLVGFVVFLVPDLEVSLGGVGRVSPQFSLYPWSTAADSSLPPNPLPSIHPRTPGAHTTLREAHLFHTAVYHILLK